MAIEGRDSGVAVPVLGLDSIPCLEQLKGIVAIGVAPKVVPQHSRLCNWIEGRIHHRTADLAANHVVTPSIDLRPLHAPVGPRRVEMASECVERLVVVIVGVERPKVDSSRVLSVHALILSTESCRDHYRARMAELMTAYRLVEWGHSPELTYVPIPVPGEDEALVAVAGNGLCHSDLTMMSMPGEVGSALGWHMPFTLGHEIGGTIVSFGPLSATASAEQFTVGQAVVLVSANSCGQCADCNRGMETLCSSATTGRGYGRDGGLAEFVVAPVRDLVAIGHVDPGRAGPLTDAAATSHHAVARVAKYLQSADSSVAVLGAGGLGIFACQILAALTPARILVVDRDPVRRSLAQERGAHQVLDGIDRSTAKALREASDGGVDVVIDVIGTDDSIIAGMRSMRGGGSFALVGSEGGLLPKSWFSNFPQEAEIFTFQGSTRRDVAAVAALLGQGAVELDVEVAALSEVTAAYERLGAGSLTGRIVVQPGR